MTLSDGSQITKEANNAGEAIAAALWASRGRTVTKCHSDALGGVE